LRLAALSWLINLDQWQGDAYAALSLASATVAPFAGWVRLVIAGRCRHELGSQAARSGITAAAEVSSYPGGN